MKDSKTKDNKQRQIELHRRLSQGYKDGYHFDFSKIYQRYHHDKIAAYLPKEKNIKILDCGCGIGMSLNFLLEDNYSNIFGTDISFDMLRQVDNAAMDRLFLGDAMNLPVRNNFFDVVLCRGILHHLSEHLVALKSIARALKNKGLLILSEPCDDFFLTRKARRLMYKFSQKFEQGECGLFTPEIEQLLNRAGFAIKDKYYIGFLAYTFSGFPHIFPLFKYIPFNRRMTKLLIAIDECLLRIPFIKQCGLHILICAERLAQ